MSEKRQVVKKITRFCLESLEGPIEEAIEFLKDIKRQGYYNNITIDVEYEREDPYSISEYCVVYGSKDETKEEEKKRIEKNKKQKASRDKNKKKRLESERREYERLKRKFDHPKEI